MAEVHARKQEEANQAGMAIERARQDRIKKEEAARKEEQAAVDAALKAHSSNVVKK